MEAFGILNLNKSPGMTSRDVVNRVQRLLKPLKVGHAGTLDPLATGVLVVCVGKATRLIEYVQQQRKGYVGTFLLGRSSNTEDVDGTVVLEDAPLVPSREQLQEVLPQFRGLISQVPPAYSALKVNGQRAYKLARRGQDVALQPRDVSIYELELLRYEYPEFVLDLTCGGGTYVRSLGRDIARAAGTSAVMSSLVRTSVGPFSVDQSVDVEQLRQDNLRQHLSPPEMALDALPKVTLSRDQISEIVYGKWLDDPRLVAADANAAQDVAAFDEQTKLVAILRPRDEGKLVPIRNFLSPQDVALL